MTVPAPRRFLTIWAAAASAAGLAACVGGSQVGAASAVGTTDRAPTVPVLSTSAPACPKKQISTIDTEDCGLRDLAKLNRMINVVARSVFARLRARDQLTHRFDTGFPADYGRQQFVAGERAWLGYRNAFCRSEGNVAEGGTAAGIYSVYCEVSVDSQHLKDLKAFDRALGPH